MALPALEQISEAPLSDRGPEELFGLLDADRSSFFIITKARHSFCNDLQIDIPRPAAERQYSLGTVPRNDRVATISGLAYAVTGLWPIISLQIRRGELVMWRL